MRNKTVGRLFLVLLVLSILSLSVNVRIGKANPGIIIDLDGSIIPSTAPIQRAGNVYTFTADIFDSIEVKAFHIIIDGNNSKLQGPGTGIGFNMFGSGDVTIKNTIITGWSTGISFDSVFGGAAENNLITNNNRGVYLGEYEDVSLSENTITNNVLAISYLYFHGANITGNIITNNQMGIGGHGLSQSVIKGNSISDNTDTGILLYDAISNNVSANSIEHSGVGVLLSAEISASNNRIFDNTIAYNDYGFEIGRYQYGGSQPVGNNFIYHNSFLSNTRKSASVNGTSQINYWDNGYPSGGNFWSDYNGVDMYSGPSQNLTGSDGIGDTPYIIAPNNIDRYPFKINTITINPDGSVSPSIAPIHREGDLYTLTSNIYSGIVVCRGNIIFDGNNFKLQGMGSGMGFYVPHSYWNVTIRNTGVSGFSTGIRMYDTWTGAIEDCTITNNSLGISFVDANGITVSGNLLVNNTNAIDYYYIVYINSVEANWVNNRITNNQNGITGRALALTNILNNIIANNTGIGIQLDSGHGNIIRHNSIQHNNVGIYFSSMGAGSSHNTIAENVIAYNSIGLKIDPGIPFVPTNVDNSFYHNNFIYNTQQTYAPLGDGGPQPNAWDNGYPSGGNFWSNYTGVDLYGGPAQNVTGGDGMGDTPYVIAQENVDRYPLMTPYNTTEFFILRITATTGGTTNPAPGSYVYTSGTVVEVTAVPEADYMLDYWELDSVNVGTTNPVALTMSANHALKAVFKTRPDIAVTSVVPYPTSVRRGQLVYVDVTVANQGFTSETFDIVVYADADRKTIGDEIIVGVQTVYNLLPGGTKTITFVWDTSTLPSGTTYYISAKAIVPYDIDPTNNLLTAKKKVTIRR